MKFYRLLEYSKHSDNSNSRIAMSTPLHSSSFSVEIRCNEPTRRNEFLAVEECHGEQSVCPRAVFRAFQRDKISSNEVQLED